jgi:DNA-binding transcriptional MerR regulator
MRSFTIGTLARSANVSVETVRYYERRGLLDQPARGNGYRQYSEDDVERLALVRRAKALGFTLAEIRELLGTGGAARTRSAGEILVAARAKLGQVDDDLRHLTLLRGRLSDLVQACEDGSDDCVALEVAPPCSPA